MSKLTFSQRYGYTEIKNYLQKEEMDEKLKNAIWNVFYVTFFYKKTDNDSKQKDFFINVWLNFFHNRIDLYDLYDKNFFEEYFCNWFFERAEFNDIYEFIEFYNLNYEDEKFDNLINRLLEKHNSAYRLIGNYLILINSEEEIKEIETAINSPLDEMNEHLKKSLHLLSNREKPDYRNSIKESISAVEYICRKITGESDLGKAIAHLEEKGIKLNVRLKTGISNLYQYTNDKNGIRHPILDMNEEVNMEEARFMLITCSAFVNYLLEKVNKLEFKLK